MAPLLVIRGAAVTGGDCELGPPPGLHRIPSCPGRLIGRSSPPSRCLGRTPTFIIIEPEAQGAVVHDRAARGVSRATVLVGGGTQYVCPCRLARQRVLDVVILENVVGGAAHTWALQFPPCPGASILPDRVQRLLTKAVIASARRQRHARARAVPVAQSEIARASGQTALRGGQRTAHRLALADVCLVRGRQRRRPGCPTPRGRARTMQLIRAVTNLRIDLSLPRANAPDRARLSMCPDSAHAPTARHRQSTSRRYEVPTGLDQAVRQAA